MKTDYLPIEHAPIGNEMFVAIAIDIQPTMNKHFTYTSDPYVVWQPAAGVFKRWPHHFAPTHYYPLPSRK